MHDFPACRGLMQDNCSPVEKSGPIIQVKCRNCDVAEDLNLHVLWLNVHEWCMRLSVTNLLEDNFERLFEFGTSAGALAKPSRIEHRRIVIEC